MNIFTLQSVLDNMQKTVFSYRLLKGNNHKLFSKNAFPVICEE